jgi:hypothetical protein
MLDLLLLPLMVYAACGLALSLIVHVVTFVGVKPGPDALFFALHIGIFPLWLPVVLITMAMGVGSGRGWGWSGGGWKTWKAILAGCPPWMQYMTYGFFIYAIINFAIFIMIAPTGKQASGGTPSVVWHGFSGHWMAFYSAGLAILTSAYRRGLRNLRPKCPNGHAVALGDRFCPDCGALVDTQAAASRVS